MELADQHIYPEGEIYVGQAADIVDHMEFLAAYTKYIDAVALIYTGYEKAAEQNGYKLLTIDISYEEGVLYHMFDIHYRYALEESTIKQTPIPAALLYIALTIIIGIVGYILINTITKSITTILYDPFNTGEPGGASTTTYIIYGLIGIFLLKALTGASQEIRRY
jgi:hypothetical protein